MTIGKIINNPITKFGFNTLNPFTSKEKAAAFASAIFTCYYANSIYNKNYCYYYDGSFIFDSIVVGTVIFVGLKAYKFLDGQQQKISTANTSTQTPPLKKKSDLPNPLTKTPETIVDPDSNSLGDKIEDID